MHGGVRLKVVLNVHLVFLEHEVDFALVSASLVYFIKIAADLCLFIMEAIKINSANSPDVLGHQLSEHTSKNLFSYEK